MAGILIDLILKGFDFLYRIMIVPGIVSVIKYYVVGAITRYFAEAGSHD